MKGQKTKMPDRTIVTTDRLEKQPYAPEHLDDLFAMNAHPDVMRYIGETQTRAEAAKSITRQQEKWAKHGFGWWALLERLTGAFVGAACLQHLGHIESNPLEIGWRLIPPAQGKAMRLKRGKRQWIMGLT